MTKMEYLLTCLAEEAVEIAQRATKAIRFGTGEIQPGQELTNMQRILGEYSDLEAIFQMIAENEAHWHAIESGLLPWHIRIAMKKEKVEKFMELSRQLGILRD